MNQAAAAPPRTASPPPAHGLLLTLALVKLAFHLATIQGYGWFRDEFYYVACARRLAWGYVDHPPLAPALLAPLIEVLGVSLPVVRFLPALAGAVLVYVTGRIAHAHLKDVDADLAAAVKAGTLSYTEAVRRGMYTPLGAGDVDIAGIVAALRSNGFDGWFVMEQDTILEGEPTDEGPVRDVRASVTYMRNLCRSVAV